MTEVLSLLSAQGLGTQYVVIVIFASVLALLSRNGFCSGIVGFCSVISVGFEVSIHQGLLAYFVLMVIMIGGLAYVKKEEEKEKKLAETKPASDAKA